MLQVREFNSDTECLPQPTLWSERRHGNRLDCETAVLLRQVVAPVFDQATSWSDLRKALSAQGLDLRFEEGRLILVETLRGTKICSCRFLGHPLAALVARFGKLRTRAPKSRAGFAQVMIGQ